MKRVKDKATVIRTLGAIDLHFHGAFGVDLMKASPRDLDRMCRRLFAKGVAAFLPTTLSARQRPLEEALRRLGDWIHGWHETGPRAGYAFPLGIHLEGPFLSRSCCGAHPPSNLIAPSLSLLRRWHEESRKTLARVTLAPERGPWPEIRRILHWAREHQITISIGHSDAPPDLVEKAFHEGARALTHAWNAMPFHHRHPGILGAALGHPGLLIELIPDGVHVADVVTLWTHRLHPSGICWVSDAVPAAHTAGWSSFGPLRVRVQKGAGRTTGGHLAGGGKTLFEMVSDFWKRTRRIAPSPLRDSLTPHALIDALVQHPLTSQPSAQRWIRLLERTHRFDYQFGRSLKIQPVD